MLYDEGAEMKKFRMTADIAFEADDIDHAFTLLREHFQALLDESSGSDWAPTWFVGEMDIRAAE